MIKGRLSPLAEREMKLSALFHNPSESRHKVERSRTLRTNEKRAGDKAANQRTEREELSGAPPPQ